MAETRAPPLFINRLGTPHTLVVAPAMLDSLEHRADARFGSYGNQTGNAAHINCGLRIADCGLKRAFVRFST
jgi:hypothetical protein